MMASSSDIDGHRKFWNNLWKLNIPNKVKFFLWRAYTHSIPTMLNLCKRKIVPSSACNHCHVGEESVLHALWSCEAVCSVWCSCFPALPSEFTRVSSFRDLLELVVCSSLNSKVFAMVCSALWNRRNKMWIGEVVWPLNQVVGIRGVICKSFSRFGIVLVRKFVHSNLDGNLLIRVL